MSKFRALLLLTTVMPAVAACGADDIASPGEGQVVIVNPPAPPPPPPPPPPPTGGPAADCPTGTANVGVVANRRNCQISGVLTGNVVVRNLPGVIYSLNGRVDVGRDLGGDGQQAGGAQGILTVEPGVVMFGSSGADFLLINRGSQIFAEGTATQPIVFTSRANIEGTTTASSIGQWGGLVILGRAPIQRCIGAGVVGGSVNCQSQIEGTSNAFYGGASPNDNSGRLRYVQVRYPGFEISPGNELNGITFGGVGNGTTVEYVQVHNSSDDGIEWFGGTVNQRYIIVTGADDDSLDTDFGFKGYTQFALVLQREGAGDKGIEADTTGNGNATPRSHPRISNMTIVVRSNQDAIHMRGGTDFTLVNSVVAGGPNTPFCLRVDEEVTVQAANPTLDERGPPRFESVFFACPQPFRNRADVTAAQLEAIFGGGSNNVARGTSTLSSLFINGANENGVTPFAAASLNTAAPTQGNPASGPFFVNTPYIGAFRDAQDLWFQGWACGLGFNTPSCAASPVS